MKCLANVSTVHESQIQVTYSKWFVHVFVKESWKELSNEEDVPPEFTPPPPPPRPPARDPHNGKVEPSFFPENEIIEPKEIYSLG